ncbi:MAG: hypothetical protein CMP11_09425 [Zetaproteobacteria bacterium]|nr:hypothetical protein [Pseudobdellovibrionaceae bacterium]|tara:strand:+ start:3701 stop:5530 length:1830 start_codon:yes stop_codon:yes gene_type:complete
MKPKVLNQTYNFFILLIINLSLNAWASQDHAHKGFENNPGKQLNRADGSYSSLDGSMNGHKSENIKKHEPLCLGHLKTLLRAKPISPKGVAEMELNTEENDESLVMIHEVMSQKVYSFPNFNDPDKPFWSRFIEDSAILFRALPIDLLVVEHKQGRRLRQEDIELLKPEEMSRHVIRLAKDLKIKLAIYEDKTSPFPLKSLSVVIVHPKVETKIKLQSPKEFLLDQTNIDDASIPLFECQDWIIGAFLENFMEEVFDKQLEDLYYFDLVSNRDLKILKLGLTEAIMRRMKGNKSECFSIPFNRKSFVPEKNPAFLSYEMKRKSFFILEGALQKKLGNNSVDLDQLERKYFFRTREELRKRTTDPIENRLLEIVEDIDSLYSGRPAKHTQKSKAQRVLEQIVQDLQNSSNRNSHKIEQTYSSIQNKEKIDAETFARESESCYLEVLNEIDTLRWDRLKEAAFKFHDTDQQGSIAKIINETDSDFWDAHSIEEKRVRMFDTLELLSLKNCNHSSEEQELLYWVYEAKKTCQHRNKNPFESFDEKSSQLLQIIEGYRSKEPCCLASAWFFLFNSRQAKIKNQSTLPQTNYEIMSKEESKKALRQYQDFRARK